MSNREIPTLLKLSEKWPDRLTNGSFAETEVLPAERICLPLVRSRASLGRSRHPRSNAFRFLTADALETVLPGYIHWYNTERISTKLKGLSPVQYRAQTLAA